MFGAQFPQTQWDAYVQAVTEMYVPVIENRLETEAAGAGSAAGAESGAGAGNAAGAEPGAGGFGAGQTGTAQAPDPAQLPENVVAAQTAFLAALSRVTDGMKAGIDQQISMLDPNVPDEAQQIAILNVQKQQLDELAGGLPQLAFGLGQARATRQALNAQLARLAEQEQSAQEQFAAAWQQIADSER